jgi:hypothetical protein
MSPRNLPVSLVRRAFFDKLRDDSAPLPQTEISVTIGMTEYCYCLLTFDGISAAMMIASSTFNPLPEKSSSALDLISWVGRGNVLTITVDTALLSEGILGRDIR